MTISDQDTPMDYEVDTTAMLKAFNRLAPHDHKETALQAKVLLIIARDGECTSRHLQNELGVNQSTISRETRALGNGRGRHGKRRWNGKGLVRSFRDPGKPQRYRFVLTDEGERLVTEAVGILRKAAVENLL